MDWYLRKQLLSTHILYKKPKSPVNDNQTMVDEESSHPTSPTYVGSLFYISEMERRNCGFLLDLAFASALEEEMATQSRILAWRIPGTGELGGLPSLGSHRVGHDCSDLAAAAAIVLPPDLVVYRFNSAGRKSLVCV